MMNRFQNGCGVNAAANDNCNCKCFHPCGIGCGMVSYVGPTGPTASMIYTQPLKRAKLQQNKKKIPL